MKVFALVGFLAFLAYASADCGCLQDRVYVVADRPSPYVCSKHLTVVGKTVQTGGCPPATVIYRGRPSYAGSQSLPIRVQTPVAAGPVVGVAGSSDLTYKIVNSAPCGVNVKVSEPVGVKYDTRIEVPVPTAVRSTTVNLKPCVDRVVLPSPSVGPAINTVREETVYVNPIREYEIDAPVYASSIGSYGNTEVVYGAVSDSPVYVNTIRKSPVYVNPIRSCGTCGGAEVLVNPIRSSPIYVNPIRTSGPIYKTETVHVPSGPALDCRVTKKVVSRC